MTHSSHEDVANTILISIQLHTEGFLRVVAFHKFRVAHLAPHDLWFKWKMPPDALSLIEIEVTESLEGDSSWKLLPHSSYLRFSFHRSAHASLCLFFLPQHLHNYCDLIACPTRVLLDKAWTMESIEGNIV